jgi:hypothetical protein
LRLPEDRLTVEPDRFWLPYELPGRLALEPELRVAPPL